MEDTYELYHLFLDDIRYPDGAYLYDKDVNLIDASGIAKRRKMEYLLAKKEPHTVLIHEKL
jgi:hypothetical protein